MRQGWCRVGKTGQLGRNRACCGEAGGWRSWVWGILACPSPREASGQTAGKCMTKVCDGSVLGAEKMGGVGHPSPYPPLICLGGSSRLPCEPSTSLNVCRFRLIGQRTTILTEKNYNSGLKLGRGARNGGHNADSEGRPERPRETALR